MKVIDDPSFNDDYPEAYRWGTVLQNNIQSLAQAIAFHIEMDLRTPDRLLVPGLRYALCLLAEIAEVM